MFPGVVRRRLSAGRRKSGGARRARRGFLLGRLRRPFGRVNVQLELVGGAGFQSLATSPLGRVNVQTELVLVCAHEVFLLSSRRAARRGGASLVWFPPARRRSLAHAPPPWDHTYGF